MLGIAHEIRSNSKATLYTWTHPCLANWQKIYIHQLCVDIGYHLEDLRGMDSERLSMEFMQHLDDECDYFKP